MADLAKIILPSGDEYNFKDAQAREHIQNHNNPHQVTAEQTGAISKISDYKFSNVSGWYRFLTINISAGQSKSILLLVQDTYSYSGGSASYKAIISLYITRTSSGGFSASANLLTGYGFTNDKFYYTYDSSSGNVSVYIFKNTNSNGYIGVTVLSSSNRGGSYIDLSENFESTSIATLPEGGWYFKAMQDGAGNIIPDTYATKDELLSTVINKGAIGSSIDIDTLTTPGMWYSATGLQTNWPNQGKPGRLVVFGSNSAYPPRKVQLVVCNTDGVDDAKFYYRIGISSGLSSPWGSWICVATMATLDTKANQSQLATVETGTTASQAYSAGDYFCMNGLLYKVTTAISSGQTFTPGTNCAVVTGGLSSEMQPKLVFDGVPTHLSSNPVSSDGLYSAITAVPPWYQGVDLTTVFATEIAASPYNGDPWAWIKARITDGDWHGLHIGDYIPFTTTEDSPKTYQAQIAGINTYKNYGNVVVNNQIDFICRELWETRHPMNPVNFNNGTKFGDAAATEYPWLASDLYLYINSLAGKVPNSTTVGGGTGTDVDYTSGGVYYYLPSALKAKIVEKRAYLPSRYSASGLLSDDNLGGWTYIGKLWLPSEFEVYGAPVWGGKGGYATMGNNVQYPYFAGNMNRAKNRSGSRDNWWVLSVNSGDTTGWCMVSSSGHSSRSVTSGSKIAAPICFRIA